MPGKVFAHVLLAHIQPLIDLTCHPEQSGFVAGSSTIDAILALRLLSELHREFDRPLNVIYLDTKAAFDSVDRRALWKALRSRGVPAILLDLISATSRRLSRSSARRTGIIGSSTHNLRVPTGVCSGPITFLHCHRLDPTAHDIATRDHRGPTTLH